MIKFYLSIKNPFWKDSMDSLFKTYFYWAKRITENKILEVQISRHFYYIFTVDVDISFTGNDHDGPSIEINLFGYSVGISLQDTRHWDGENDEWASD